MFHTTANPHQLAAEWYAKLQRERRIANDEHNCIEHLIELAGWDVVELKRWKPGVVQYRARRISGSCAEQKIGYAKDSVFQFV